MKNKEYKKLKKNVKTAKALLTVYEADSLPEGFEFRIDEDLIKWDSIDEFKEYIKKAEKKLYKEKKRRIVKKTRAIVTFGLWK